VENDTIPSTVSAETPASPSDSPPTLVVADPSLVLLVGPAGSGKSTLAARLFAPDEILSSDALRAVVSGDPADQGASRAAFAMLHRETSRRLQAGLLTVIDATNVRAEHRRPLVRRSHDANVPMAAIVLDLAADVVLRRNRARERVVHVDVVRRQLSWLRGTIDDGQLVREGVDPVVILESTAAIDALTIDRRGPAV